jgi:hypothetical protein
MPPAAAAITMHTAARIFHELAGVTRGKLLLATAFRRIKTCVLESVEDEDDQEQVLDDCFAHAIMDGRHCTDVTSPPESLSHARRYFLTVL